MNRTEILLNNAKITLTDWDYSNLGEFHKYGLTFDFWVLFAKSIRLVIHIVVILTLPVSVPLITVFSRWLEIQNLKSWVKTMRNDKEFFPKHYYVELKRHLSEYEHAYKLTLNW